MSAEFDVEVDEKVKVKHKEPNLYKVILLNDDKTPIDFVISLLVELFKHSTETAYAITLKVHEEGSGVAGVYSFEIAEQKVVEAVEVSRSHGFPLGLKLEEDK